MAAGKAGKTEPSERTATKAIQRYVAKQAIVKSSEYLGTVMVASGAAMLKRKEPFVTQTITGHYTTAIGMSANEQYLSQSRYEIFKRESPGYVKKVGDRGAPTSQQRFTTTTEFTRARHKPAWFAPFGGAKVVVDPKGPDFLHSIEDFESREKRQAAYRRKARVRVAAGTALRVGVAPAMYLYSGYSLFSRAKADELWLQEEATDVYGPIMGPLLAAGADTITMGGLAPLPELQKTNTKSAKPMLWYMLGGS